MLPLDEADIQRTVCQHLTARPAHGLVWFHPANGGWRHHVEAARFVGLGVKPGVSDLILLRGGLFHALEIKAHAKSKVSKAQKQFVADVRNAGGIAPHSARKCWENTKKLHILLKSVIRLSRQLGSELPRRIPRLDRTPIKSIQMRLIGKIKR
jgi:hypothetical protein